MARNGLPKKYAKMGFKRGWRAYKRAKSAPKRRTAPARTKRVRRRRSYTMARRRKKKGRRKSSGSMVAKVLGAGAVYGLVREPINQGVKTLASMIPFPGIAQIVNLSDELTLAGVGWSLYRRKIPFVKNFKIAKTVGLVGMAIEAHNFTRQGIGNALFRKPSSNGNSGKLF